MPMIDITVNGRRHSVQCGDGEEARVKGLAAYIDRKIAELAAGNSQVGGRPAHASREPHDRG